MVHFIAVLTAISHELFRTPDEELGLSSADEHKHTQTSTVLHYKTAWLGKTSRSNTAFPINFKTPYQRKFFPFHCNDLVVFLYTYIFFFV